MVMIFKMRKDGLKVRKRIGKDNFGIKMDQNRLYFQNILKFLKGNKFLSTWHRQGAFIDSGPPKIFSVENDLYSQIGIVKMRKDVSFWRFLPLKFQK